MPTDHSITPLPIPPGTRRILFVGGTFDPPHIAHAQMAGAARSWIDARGDAPSVGSNGAPSSSTVIVFVPAARSPFKPPPIADDESRLEMVRAMASAIPNSAVWTDEMDRAAGAPHQPSYWVDSLARAHANVVGGSGRGQPSPVLWFLLGADQAISLHRWREPRRVLELAEPVIVLRPPVETSEVLGRTLREPGYWSDEELQFLLARVAPVALSEVSASALRAALAMGDPDALANLSPGVLRIIQRRGLYAPE